MSSARYKASPYYMRHLVALALVLFSGGISWAADLAPVSVIELRKLTLKLDQLMQAGQPRPQSDRSSARYLLRLAVLVLLLCLLRLPTAQQ